MQGVRDGAVELRGIIPRSFEQIFNQIKTAGKNTKYLVRASYLEIYNEDIHDLLVPATARDGKRDKLELKETPDKGVYVKDLTSFVVRDIAEIDKLMAIGNKARAVGSTLMNAESSRSHSIFTITIECSETTAGEEHIRVGKLHLVDLAGSERQSKTGATGDRLKEAAKINLSLTALGNVISALVDGKSGHIPYRDSKLTRLLQDSLGGNSKTMMIATASPAVYNLDETLSTLRYANRAKQIKNKPKVNEDPKDTMLRECEDEIIKLKEQLAATEESGATFEMNEAGNALSDAKNRPLQQISDGRIKQMQDDIAQERESVIELKGMVEAERAKLLIELDQRSAEIEKERLAREEIQAQIQKLQEKLLVGGVNLLDETERHAIELQQQSAVLEEKAMIERQLQRDLQIQDEQKLQIEETYATLQEESNIKTQKLKKLWTVTMKHKQDLSDTQAEIQREREDLLNTIRQLSLDIQYKALIASAFIPQQYSDYIESHARYDVNTETWQVPFANQVDLSERKATQTRRHKTVNGAEDNMDWTMDPEILLPDGLLTYEMFGVNFNGPVALKVRGRKISVKLAPADAAKQAEDLQNSMPEARGLLAKTKHYA